jgi:hypothetical protein
MYIFMSIGCHVNYLVSASALVLFALFYNMSGGATFAPAAADQITQVEPAEPQFTFTEFYVPFDKPIIIPAPAPVKVARAEPQHDTNVIQAAFAINSAPTAAADIRTIAGNRVNVRSGPGTNHAVMDTVSRGTEVALLQQNDSGWAQIRLIAANQTAWVAARLLSD